ncbi:MAG TPA: hypothetical protein VL484_02450 [Vicinamibacterales bacterium]|jgi:hypothetical protein|nr:hypothetical protein [Vicinamibacterales bacterium]
MSPSAGYSGTPLAKKLGIKDGMRWAALNAPAGYETWLAGLPSTATIVGRLTAPATAVHVFATKRSALARTLKTLRKQLQPDGFVWVSWPKRASGVPTDITEDVIREVALPLGFVDVKVCAVTETWSGLKLTIRRSERK